MKTRTFGRYHFVAAALFLICYHCIAQNEDYFDPTGAVRSQLGAAITARFGSGFTVQFAIMDSLLAHGADIRSWPREGVADPYGTLRGCIFFTARKSGDQAELEVDTCITGVFKGGQIIWDNSPGSKDGIGASILATQDINNDGEVDILTPSWSDSFLRTNGENITFLSILSWNGTRGRFINDIDSNPDDVGSTTYARSTLISEDGVFETLDADGNGILEIRGVVGEGWLDEFPDYRTTTTPYVTYGWNGSRYGLWPSTRQVPQDEFLPANRLSASIRCAVFATDDRFVYSYVVTNKQTSQQRIQRFFVTGISQIGSATAPTSWISGGSRYLEGIAFLELSVDRMETIAPGDSKSGFVVTSRGLPSIVRYYVQGLTASLPFVSDQEKRSDIINNSFSGSTLGVVDTVRPAVNSSFLDSLAGFVAQSYSLGWITSQGIGDKYFGYFASAKSQLAASNISGARSTLRTVLQDVNVDSSSSLASEAYALIRYNTEYVLAQLPAAPPPGLIVKLVGSTGSKLSGGSLQYYDSSWKDAINNGDGTFTIATTLKTLSLRLTYEGGSQTKSNVTVGPDTVVFQTVNAQVKLQNSQGALIDTGSVQYYASSWRTFGTTTNGIATKELLPASYSFGMTYASGSNDKQQDIGSNPVVVFQTVNATIQLKNSQATLIDQGSVQYYAGAWRVFGVTTGGVVSKELLPNTYSFRTTYAYGSKDQQQNIGTNPTVVFQTVNATVQLKNSQSVLMDQGTVQYYAGAWRTFGTTTGGSVSKELLPISYSFRMTNEGVSNDKTQDISANATVSYSTVLCTVNVKNSQGQPVDNATISYYVGSWRQIGPTVGGQVTKELLPANLTFRMAIGGVTQDKAQNIGTNALVQFTTQ